MKKINSQLVFSPSDLATFHRSSFASFLDRLQLEEPALLASLDVSPDLDPMMALLGEQGDQHEASVLNDLINAYGSENVALINKEHTSAFVDTANAMQQGKTVIFQAALQRDNYAGYADFLLKVPGSSKLGDYTYEVWDAKLSHHAKAEHMLQICFYSWMLEPLLKTRCTTAGFFLGGGERKKVRHTEYFAYFLATKHRFESFQHNFSGQLSDCPDPALESDYGRWASYAEQYLQDSDSLALVANIRRSQITKLNQAGIQTMSALAEATLERVEGIGPSTYDALRQQAQLQAISKEQPLPAITHLAPQAGKGLATLPPHHSADVYFDIEGHPLVEGGLEYLWGATLNDNELNRHEPRGDRYPFVDWWAHDRVQEKLLIESFIDWVYARWQANPGMHVYHYASYEITAITKLTGRFNTRMDKVDELLRNQVFVDLYRVVRQSMQIGAPSYSIKKVEKLYGREHAGEVQNGAESIVEYESWRKQAGIYDPTATTPTGWSGSQTLTDIRNYNIDDCESTLELVLWLREQQQAQQIVYDNPVQDTPAEPPEPKPHQLQQQALRCQFESDPSLQADPSACDLMELLEFHQRESKPKWWAYFDRLSSTQDELYANDMAIVDAKVMAQVQDGNSLSVTLKYDGEQPVRHDKIDSVKVSDFDLLEAKKLQFDPASATVTITLPSEVLDAYTVPTKLTLIGMEANINTANLEQSLADITDAYFQRRELPLHLTQLLNKQVPTFTGEATWPLRRTPTMSDEAWLQAISDAICAMSGSVVAVQGPPGAGKTYTARKVIRDLLAQGKRVGIMSNSHAAILNLQTAVSQDTQLRHVKIGGAGKNQAAFRERYSEERYPNFMYRPSASFTKRDPFDSFPLIGATAYAWVREFALDNPVDYLFVDEASQVSLANLVAVSPAARNIVLMGDQMQLEQPIQGSHPGVAALSALEHLLGEHAVLPAELGVFLNKTYRMHPAVCRPLSELVYQGQLISAEHREKQRIQCSALPEAGIHYLPVEHSGNTQSSREEVEKVRQLLSLLHDATMTDIHGESHGMKAEDILIVAPYNQQVNLLKQELGEHYRVGTIDKFQGQEAQVVIISMASSLPSESSRGVNFLFDINRLNVAVSRAKALAIIVASPALQDCTAGNLEQMKKVSAYFELVSQAQ